MGNILLTLISTFCLAIGILLVKKRNHNRKNKFAFYFYIYITLVLFFTYFISDYFTGDGINEAVLYHLKYGLEGAGFLEYLWLISIVVSSLIIINIILFQKNKNQNQKVINKSGAVKLHCVLILSIASNPATIDLHDYFKSDSDTYNLKVITTPINIDTAKSEKNFIKFSDFYIEPSIEKIGESEKNLVVIYAESLERSYFDQNQFPGLIKHLRELETVSINFTNINQVYSTGFTIGGLTASQCGIPLIAPSGGNSMSGMDQFLPSAVCLGDLLRSSGYKLKYFGGAKLNFAGKGKLFTSHSFDEVYGLTELKPKLKDQNYQSYWGVHDDSLLEIVYNDFLNSSKTNEKFGIFLLTLDTHHPRGHINKSCEQIKYKNGKNAILNSIACSDLLISNFINKIKQSKYAENTIIVVLSDHLAMNNTAYTQLSEINRNNLLMIIDPSREEAKTIDKLGSTMDIGPTIMPYIGHKVDLGLGRDLLDSNVTNINQKLIHNNLRNWKKEITSFWDFPRIKNQLGIDIENDRISIDDRNFDIPILIELDTKLKTMLYFDADLNTNDSKIESGTSIDPNNYFLLIDRCSNVHRIAPYLKGSNYCFVTGKGNKIFHATKLTKNLTLDVTSIKFKLNIHNGFDAARVAHAGGGINGKTYTNSIEALDLNYQDGFRYFEIDFSFTTDNKMVCLHDWEDSFSRSFGLASTGKISESDFVELVNTKSKFKKCTAKSLAMWMRSHPDALIITDIKEQNIQGLKQLLKILPNAKNRVIPQIYFPENLKPIKKLGFEKIIWTLYKYSGSKNDILNVLDNNRHPIAVTMPIGRAKTDLPFLLDRMNIPSYVHTINDAELAKKYMFINGVTEIYTDFLSPGACCSELK